MPGAGPRRRLITFVKDRPGHDLRYAIDCTRIETELGWSPREDFRYRAAATIEWYLANRGWVDRVRSGDYRAGSGSTTVRRDEGSTGGSAPAVPACQL